MRLGFVGTGAITSAMVTGLSSGVAEPPAIRLSPRDPGIAADLANRFPRVSIASSNQDVLDHSAIVVLAIRPQIAPHVISELRFRPEHRVISVVSGLSLRLVSDLTTPAAKITRVVPLPSVANKRGPTAIYPPDGMVADLFAKLALRLKSKEKANSTHCVQRRQRLLLTLHLPTVLLPGWWDKAFRRAKLATTWRRSLADSATPLLRRRSAAFSLWLATMQPREV